MPSTAPKPKASRQPRSIGSSTVLSSTSDSAEPAAEPEAAACLSEPAIARPAPPLTGAGIGPAIAEVIPAYSPPVPAPVRKRQRKKYQAEKEKALATVATR